MFKTDASNCIHFMIYLFITQSSVFLIFMFDIFFNYTFFGTFCCSVTFGIIFSIGIHFGSQSNKLSDRNTSGFIFEFSNNFLICFIEVFRVCCVITNIKPVFIIPKVSIYVFSFNLIC